MGIEYNYTIEYKEKTKKITNIEADEYIKTNVNLKETKNAEEMNKKINEYFLSTGGLCQRQYEQDVIK